MPVRYFGSPTDFDPKTNYYEILEIREGAKKDEIKNGYFRLAQFYHPDRQGGDKHMLSKFQEITNAYQILNDDAKRKRYDALRAGKEDPEDAYGN